MTSLERYTMIREQSENFTRKAMLKHHLIKHMDEAVDEKLDDILFLIHERYPATDPALVAAIRDLKFVS